MLIQDVLTAHEVQLAPSCLLRFLRKGHGAKGFHSQYKTSVRLRNKTRCQPSNLEPSPREFTVLNHKINPVIFFLIFGPIKTYSIFKKYFLSLMEKAEWFPEVGINELG